MRRLVVLVAFALLAGLAPSLRVVRAQDTPVLPAIGDPVTFPAGEDGGEVTITVAEVVDPFGAFGAGAAPAGSRYVYVVLTVANGGDEPLSFDPATVFLVDAAGFVYRPADLFGDDATGGDNATPAASSRQTVEPGAEVEGGVVFALPEAATVAALYHAPAPERLILLAILGGAPTGGDATDGEDTDGEANDETPSVGENGGPDDDETPIAVGDVDCDAYATYYGETTARIERLEEIASGLEGLVNTLAADPIGAGETVQGWADDIATLAEEQEEAEVPAGLEELNDQAVEAFATYADAFEQLATGLASFDVTAIQGVIPVLQQGDDLQTEVIDQLNAVAEGCGIEVEVEE